MDRANTLSFRGRSMVVAAAPILVLVLLGISACSPSDADREVAGADAMQLVPEPEGASADGPGPASPRPREAGHVAVRGPEVPALTLHRGQVGPGEPLPMLDTAGLQPRGEAGETGRVLAITGALTVQIEAASGPLEVRLAEIDTPVPDAARAALERWLAGRSVRLVYSGLRRDRYDRALAQLVLQPPEEAGDTGVQDDEGPALEDPQAGDWLQGRLVAAGLARVMTHADNQAHAVPLLALEARARAAGIGLWGNPAHAVRDPHPDARAQDIGSAQLVAGRVVEAVQLENGRIYLNFGSDYRTDFTVRIEAADSAAFIEAGLGPDALIDRRVRVRGWLVEENGPMIRIDHPARLEILTEDTSDARPR